MLNREVGSINKPLPKLETDEDVESLIETDLSGYLAEENLTAVSDYEIDFSDVPESTPKELKRAKRIEPPAT